MLKGLKVIVPMSLILDIQVLVSQCIADMQYIDMFKKEIVRSVPPFLTHQCDLMAKILSERKCSVMNIMNITRQFLKDEAIHLETLTASHLTTVECSVNRKYQGYFNICSKSVVVRGSSWFVARRGSWLVVVRGLSWFMARHG